MKAITAAAAPTQKTKSKSKPRGLPRPRKNVPTLAPTFDHVLPNTLAQLHYHATLLQQLHVRHKNQHRGQLWFKQLSLLRRAVRNLLEGEIKLLDLQQARSINPGNNSAESIRRKFGMERQLRSRNGELREWIREVLIPESYVRFSVLVADGEGGFANLGVVLVAAVAALANVVVGLPQAPAERKGIERDGCDAARDSVQNHQKQPEVGDEAVSGKRECQGEPEDDMHLADDFGTVVDRDRVSEGLRGREEKEKPLLMSSCFLSPMRIHKEEEQEEAIHPGKKRSNDSGSGPFSNNKTPGKRKLDASLIEAASREASPSSAAATTKLSKSTPKRGKRKKNAIDDLFADFA